MLTAATLFSGIGAPEVAMPHWRWAWHAEIEKFPSAVLAARHPGSINLGDVSADDFTHRAAGIARPNVLVFGSPCQSFSVAGKRLGLDDPRGNLALVSLGIVDRLKPDWFVFENVPGLLSSGGGRDFGSFLGTVADIRYHGCWDVLDAQWFGVAQRRNRVFFVGNSRDWRHSAAVLLEPESLCGNYPPRRQAGQRPSGTIDAGAHPGSYSGQDAYNDRLIAKSLCAADGGIDREDRHTLVTHALRAEGFDASEDGTGRGTPLVFDTKQVTSKANRSIPKAGDPSHPLAAGAHAPAIAFDCKASGQSGFGIGEIGSTMRAMGHANTHQNGGGHQAVNVGSSVRRLTPRECERLQGFPDDYTLIDVRGKPAADGPRYKALGNSMAVPVVRWILSRIEMFETQARPALALIGR